MAKYKTLKSVAHNMGHSFISLMNYYDNDYVLGHIQKQMLLTGLNKLEINLLNNDIKPTELLTNPIQQSIERYVSWLPELVKESKSEMDLVKEAKLIIEFDLNINRPYPNAIEYTENPYKCISYIIDNRGKEYKYEFNDWWFPEALKKDEMKQNLFAKFMNWIKKK